MGLRGSIRASFNTMSIIEHRSLNAIARGRIPNKIQHGHRPPFLCNRIYYGASTHVPLHAQRLLRCPSDLDGDILTARDHVAVKTAMEERQARERERYQRQTAFAAYRMSGKSSYNTPYLHKALVYAIRNSRLVAC